MDNKRTLLAIALSIMVLVVFSYLSPQRPVQMPAEPREAAVPEKIEEVQPAPVEIPAGPVDMPALEKEIRVETDLYSAVFTTRGGTIKRWDLKEYADKDGNPVSLISTDPKIPPVSIILDSRQPELPSKVNFSTDREFIKLSGTNKSTLTLSYSDSSGLSIKKTFTFYGDSYRVDFSTTVKGVPSYQVALGSKFGVFDEKGTWVHIGPLLLHGTDKIDIKGDNIEGIGFISKLLGTKSGDEFEYKENVRWIAQEDKYFTSALVSMNNANDARIWNWRDNSNSGVEISYKITGEKGDFLLYAGPKKYDLLRTMNVGLEHIVDFGFFSIIARPLFWLLTLFYKIIGNYGWSIILITIVVRTPFIPLINKGQKSMRKLQELQPHMAALKEQHKKDPQRMQRETMELYKKHKVNPMGGCLPMLIQLPVFFALYKILLIAIELRGAPFIWWIHDLSAKDPYYVFPVLMGATMILQQKMTPSGMDPKQAKMMMLMPVVFTFMFLSFPSGLVIYWLVSNLLGIVQQYFVNKKMKTAAS
ncbi:membrane protein insertase YidC [bacterium BMS3Bbin08]|nr:membrane protein insertase YidC [bacterium BMS3Bbin08]